MHLLLIGLNHETASIELREQLSVSGEAVEATVTKLASESGLYEAVLLATCNRTELYGTSLSVHGLERMTDALAAMAGLEVEALKKHIYSKKNKDVVRHLCRVSAGLDSIVMGEPQILGQVREAYELAHQAGTTGSRLSKLFLTAIEAGKAVRSETALGSTPVSIATIALQLGRRLLGELSEHSILIIGAGEMCETAAVLAAERHPEKLFVLNRTLSKAQRLAELAQGSAAGLDALGDALNDADLVLIATGATTPIISQDMLVEAIGNRKGRRIVIIDMGVPRDVEPGASCLEEVFLYSVDDLQEIAQEHLRQRIAEIPRAEDVVAKAQERYLAWLDTLSVVPTIVDLRQSFEAIRLAELEQHLPKISGLDEKGRHRVEQLTQAIVNKILHEPSVRLKRRATDKTGRVIAESLRYLFALDAKDRTE